MRFGIQTAQFNATPAELIETWQFLDRETGFESLWFMDHLVAPIEGRVLDLAMFEAWTLLGAASQVTGRLRIGCLVTANTFRHPALLAKMAVTIDHLSGGRLNLAIGAGWFEEEHQAFGLSLPPIRLRLDRLAEAAAMLRKILQASGPVSFRGEHYSIERAPFAPGFLQTPHPPLLIGGGGEQRTLRIVAQYADVANVQGPVSTVRHKLDVLRSHCEAVGRSYAVIAKTVQMPVSIVDDPKELEGVRAFLVDHYQMTMQQARDEAPVGPVDHVLKVLAAYAELGVSAIIVPTPGPWDHHRLRQLDERIVRPLAEEAA